MAALDRRKGSEGFKPQQWMGGNVKGIGNSGRFHALVRTTCYLIQGEDIHIAKRYFDAFILCQREIVGMKG